ncbi:MAG: translation initiation factor IF-2 [Lachnospiraceae bacterium]|nr:translation initiation factor IF-2 [Lachnospiraceae bacterium]
MKVSELAKELSISNKEVIEALAKIGVEAKAHNSSVDDDAANKIKAQFSGKDKDKEPEKKEDKKEVTPSAEKKEAPKAPKMDQSNNAKNDAQKKKKSGIIFVSNSNNSGMSQNKPNNNQRPQGPRPGQASSKPGANQVQHTIIKPITAPSSVESTSDFRENARRLDEAQRSRNERNKTDETVKTSPSNVQNQGAEGSKPSGFKANSNGPKENNFKNKNNNVPSRDNQDRPSNNQGNKDGNGRQNDRFSKNQGQSRPAIIENAPTAGKEDKRRNNKDQDKRSKKDHIYEEETESRQKKAGRFIKPEKKVEEPQEEQIKVITIPETLTIKELADAMKMQPSQIIKKLFMQGQIVTVNTEVSYEEAENIAMEYEILCEKEVKVDVIEELLKEEDEEEDKLVSRPPVICVMGHVDHGKTSLLDAIRKTNVTDKEAGGITQHIGAYTVNVKGQSITFLDTPGHEAFTAMRMRGANSTDIAILVVAADDGVMPQTVEAINHAKAAGIEIIVAVNKIDKPGANIDRVKQEMTEYELIPVDWGGSTEFVPVSAKSGEGIDNLLETILLTAEIMELKANPNRLARGLVIEAELDKGRGPVARFLVQKGTLHVGDFISAGAAHGKVRAMQDDKGKRVKEAKPSTPVEILGLNDVPSAGEVFIAHKNDKEAKQYAETYVAQNKEKKVEETKAKMSLDDLFNQIQADNLKELNIIVKADVQGSVEAVKQSLTKLTNEEVVVKCIHGGVGAINESDVVLASASSAIIIGFNVRPDAQAKALSEREGVEVRLYKVIYQAIEDIEAAMKGMLDPVFEEKVIGHAEVRQIFKASAVGNIAGSKVMDGYFERNCMIRITRDGEQIYEGKLASLKRFKDDVKEVKEGYECGLVFEEFDQMQELDWVEAYIMVEVPR